MVNVTIQRCYDELQITSATYPSAQSHFISLWYIQWPEAGYSKLSSRVLGRDLNKSHLLKFAVLHRLSNRISGITCDLFKSRLECYESSKTSAIESSAPKHQCRQTDGYFTMSISCCLSSWSKSMLKSAESKLMEWKDKYIPQDDDNNRRNDRRCNQCKDNNQCSPVVCSLCREFLILEFRYMGVNESEHSNSFAISRFWWVRYGRIYIPPNLHQT